MIKYTLEFYDAKNSVLYEDVVNIHLNLKIGADEGLRSQRRKVVTEEQNKKHFLTGASYSSSGQQSKVQTLISRHTKN